MCENEERYPAIAAFGNRGKGSNFFSGVGPLLPTVFRTLEAANEAQIEKCLAVGGGKVIDISVRKGPKCVSVDLRRLLEFDEWTKFALFHNHPSGVAEFSKEDKDMTMVAAFVANRLNLELVDHAIYVAGDGCEVVYLRELDAGLFCPNALFVRGDERAVSLITEGPKTNDV